MSADFNVTTDLAFMRTYMAAERTHLAWIRTAMSILSFTMVLLKLYDPLKHHLNFHRTLFITVIILSLFILIFSTFRYYYTLDMIGDDDFSPDVLGIGMVSLTMGLLGIVTYYSLIPSIRKKENATMINKYSDQEDKATVSLTSDIHASLLVNAADGFD